MHHCLWEVGYSVNSKPKVVLKRGPLQIHSRLFGTANEPGFALVRRNPHEKWERQFSGD